jgi:hypothetical protein
MLPLDSRSSFFRKPWVIVSNSTSETIPPYGVMQIESVGKNSGGELVYTVAKPGSTGYPWYLVNGPFAIAAGKEGVGTNLVQGGYVMVDPGASPAIFSTYGPQTNQWYIGSSTSGFCILGGDDTVAENSVVAAIQEGQTIFGSYHRYDVTGPLSVTNNSFHSLTTGGLFSGAGTTRITDGGRDFIQTAVGGTFTVGLTCAIPAFVTSFTMSIDVFRLPSGSSTPAYIGPSIYYTSGTDAQSRSVSVSGVIELNDGDGIGVKNTSGRTIAFDSVVLWLCRQG